MTVFMPFGFTSNECLENVQNHCSYFPSFFPQGKKTLQSLDEEHIRMVRVYTSRQTCCCELWYWQLNLYPLGKTKSVPKIKC